MRTWLRMLFAELPVLRDLPDPTEPPLPRVEAELGPSVPGWLLRLAAVLATGGVLTVATQRVGMDPGFGWTVVFVASAAMALWPATGVAHVAVVVSGLLIAFDAHGPFDPVVLGLIPLAYAAVRLAWWAERLALAARVEVAALARGLGRWLAISGGTVAVGALALLLAGRPSGVGVVLGGAGLAGLTWLVVAVRRASWDA